MFLTCNISATKRSFSLQSWAQIIPTKTER